MGRKEEEEEVFTRGSRQRGEATAAAAVFIRAAFHAQPLKKRESRQRLTMEKKGFHTHKD